MELLKSFEQVEGALTAMNPLARQACIVFGTQLSEDPNLLVDPDRMLETCQGIILTALLGSGFDENNPLAIHLFVEAHGDAIYGVGVSLGTLLRNAIMDAKSVE